MFWIQLFRPQNIPNRKTNWGYRVRFYHWLLLRLLPEYRKSAISDTLNLGETQIIHNVRDYRYEQELRRFCIDTAQHLEQQNAPFNLKHRNRRSFFFSWSESLLIFHNGKSYNIKRSDIFSIESELDGHLKVSCAKDFILRSEFVIKATIQQKSSIRENIITPPRQTNKVLRQRVSIKDAIPEDQSHHKLDSETIKYRGFEENSIF